MSGERRILTYMYEFKELKFLMMSGLRISESLCVRKVGHKQRKMQHTHTHTPTQTHTHTHTNKERDV